MVSIRANKQVADEVRAIADQHKFVYSEGPLDRFARDVTRLADDDVALDDTEKLLIALQRRGVLNKAQMISLAARHLRQSKP